MTDLIIFRDVPGVADIEARLADEEANRLMRPEIEALITDLDRLSLALFGITAGQTEFRALPEDIRPYYEDDWEKHFEFLEHLYDEEGDFWSSFGLDMTDADGFPLLCVDVFGRQLVCALKRLHPAASLLFAKDRPKDRAQLEAEAEAWGRAMLGRDAG